MMLDFISKLGAATVGRAMLGSKPSPPGWFVSFKGLSSSAMMPLPSSPEFSSSESITGPSIAFAICCAMTRDLSRSLLLLLRLCAGSSTGSTTAGAGVEDINLQTKI
ncbi:hypothetical protein HanRHA438_Chr06g0266381 [Helianthus annuus]|nr:hypothetical protein HanRHA438_Chr06g0266381 [Helianthus annuus]